MRELFDNPHLRLLVAVVGLAVGVLGSVIAIGLGQAFAAIREVALNTRTRAEGSSVPATGRRVALAILAVLVQVLGVIALVGTLVGFLYVYGKVARA